MRKWNHSVFSIRNGASRYGQDSLKSFESENGEHGNELVGTVPRTNLLVGIPVIGQPSPHVRAIFNLSGSIVRLVRACTASHSPTTTITPTRHSANIHLSVMTTSSERGVVHKLSRRVADCFEGCKNRASFASDEHWRRRTRVCVEAAVSLVCYSGAEASWFWDILEPLGDIGNFENVCDSSLAGKDHSFVMHWTCLSLMVSYSAGAERQRVAEGTREVSNGIF
ncbi:hypothetical protein F5148DRAFT_1226107 [Russula earlei]|uniref:Uncharacterized protein n=1 Tax=Russula earlei TaxID=71964 RepID=A0ACC0TZU5_9AGAM|nr:hypothetical protein F5148DRAFT_1226107 [Russula earlei]